MSGEQPFVLGVDLDEVCASYTVGFRDFCAERLGIAAETLPLERSWDFREWGLDQDTFEELHRAAVIEGRIMADLEPIDGASPSLWRLSDAGGWIRIVTHRLYVNWGHSVAAGDTVDWLDRHQIPYRDLCFLGEKAEVGCDAYIDDGPHNIESLRAAGKTAIVFDQPYNRSLPGPRAHSWAEAEEMVYDLMVVAGRVAEPMLPGFDPDADRLERRTNRQV